MKRLTALEGALEHLQQLLANDKTDLTTRQIRAFLMIAKASLEGDPLTTEDLRRYLNLSSQCAHKIVDYFVRSGFIEKQLSTFDLRSKELILTDAGKQVAEFMMASDQPATEEVRRCG